MRDKTVVMTGATSGIGRLAAVRLAAMGARLVLVARDRRRAEETLALLRAQGENRAHAVHYADLSRLAEVRRVGAEIAGAEPRIDVLINNAGSIFGRRRETEEGLERTFATNHMAYFLLTQLLLDRLKAAAPARIVNTASDAHRGHRLDFADLQMRHGYTAQRAYGRSKLANILFTRALARRLEGSGVTANCLHPGFVATGLGQRDNGLFGQIVRLVMLFAGRPEAGAQTIVHLASAAELAGISGCYFYACRMHQPAAEALDEASAARLWEESARIAGLPPQ